MLKNKHPTIIVAAYKRPKALNRLLGSISRARYPCNNIVLIISIDGGGSSEVYQVAEQFQFTPGEKRVIKRDQNLGLRDHIIWCGDQTEQYGAVIVLEDDLIVDPHFFIFASAALEFYADDNDIAGIALYSPKRNEHIGLPFEPLYGGAATFPMQVPCSSGQAWNHDQWKKFKDWYKNANKSTVDNCLALPEKVKTWSESSWKKYFATFLVEKNLFFAYPYISYTTNCSDPGGTHICSGTNAHQVSLPFPHRHIIDNFRFENCQNSIIKYDAYFEASPELICYLLDNQQYQDCSVDFYGAKPESALSTRKYVVTTKDMNDPIHQFSLTYKPLELNIYYRENAHSSVYAYFGEANNILTTDYKVLKVKLAEYLSNIYDLNLIKIFANYHTKIYENSFSWKITSPLRKIAKIFMK